MNRNLFIDEYVEIENGRSYRGAMFDGCIVHLSRPMYIDFREAEISNCWFTGAWPESFIDWLNNGGSDFSPPPTGNGMRGWE